MENGYEPTEREILIITTENNERPKPIRLMEALRYYEGPTGSIMGITLNNQTSEGPQIATNKNNIELSVVETEAANEANKLQNQSKRIEKLVKKCNLLRNTTIQLLEDRHDLRLQIETGKELVEEAKRISLSPNTAEETFLCKICVTNNITHALPCRHTICSNCLVTLVEKKQWNCPFCRDENAIKQAKTLIL